MKKYIFSILFFIGCFFVIVNNNCNMISAEEPTLVDIEENGYDSRKITITFHDLQPRTELIKLHEIEYCSEGDEGCNPTIVGTTTHFFKILNTKDIPVVLSDTKAAIVEYTIVSENDGEKNYFAQPMYNDVTTNEWIPLTRSSRLFAYTLSTLNQRIVINPDGNGNARHVYDNVQYTAVRTLPISISLFDKELDENYSGVVYICESQKSCRDYLVVENNINFSIDSYGDGAKTIDIYLVKKSVTIGEENLIDQLENKNNTKKISKQIYLDTIGPEIYVEGAGDSWTWAFVEAGQKYQPVNAVCKDAVFESDDCLVHNDAAVVNIKYNTDKYQFVTYEATDRLGNTTNIAVKIKVELAEPKDNTMLYIGISGGVLLLTVVILGYFVYKNHEKKKKMSYI